MDEVGTTAAIERYLIDLAQVTSESDAEPMVRAILQRAVNRLRIVCSAILRRSYPRLMQGPLNLEVDELLDSVAERLLRSLRKVRPCTVRGFFALANQHMRWELNGLARQLDRHAPEIELEEEMALAPESSGSSVSVNVLRMLDTIEALPDDEREVFSLVRIHGLTHSEAAEVIGVSVKTVQRRLYRSLAELADKLDDLEPGQEHTNVTE